VKRKWRRVGLLHSYQNKTVSIWDEEHELAIFRMKSFIRFIGNLPTNGLTTLIYTQIYLIIFVLIWRSLVNKYGQKDGKTDGWKDGRMKVQMNEKIVSSSLVY
jgi:hypothetical protein